MGSMRSIQTFNRLLQLWGCADKKLIQLYRHCKLLQTQRSTRKQKKRLNLFLRTTLNRLMHAHTSQRSNGWEENSIYIRCKRKSCFVSNILKALEKFHNLIFTIT